MDLSKLPKIDLHRHLEGSIKPQMVYQFSQANGKLFTLEYLQQNMRYDESVKSLADYIARLGTKYMLKYSNSKEDLSKFAYQVCADAAKDNVVYLELRSCPQNYVKTPMSALDFMRGVIEGSKEAENDFDIKVNQIVTLLRRDSEKISKEMQELTISLFEKGEVVGVDLAGDEETEWKSDFIKIFRKYNEVGIPTTIHAGEVNKGIGIINLDVAVNKLNAKRIGHGVAASNCPNILKTIKDKQILIEVCPTSNVHTGNVHSLEKHPVKNFLNQQINISINSDDPVTSDITITSEYNDLIKHHDFDLELIKKTNLNSIEHAFLSREEKRKLRKKYLTMFEQATENR